MTTAANALRDDLLRRAGVEPTGVDRVDDFRAMALGMHALARLFDRAASVPLYPGAPELYTTTVKYAELAMRLTREEWQRHVERVASAEKEGERA